MESCYSRGLFVATMAVMSAGLVAAVARAGEAPRSVEEARAFCRDVLKQVRLPGRIPEDYRMQWAAPLLGLLDSKDPAVRAEAGRAFLDMIDGRNSFLLGDAVPYLSSDLSATVRMRLLAVCVARLGDGREDADPRKGHGRTVKELVRQAINRDVCPPSFAALAIALARTHDLWSPQGRHSLGMPVTEVIEQGKQELLVSRFLNVLGEAHELGRHWRITKEHDAVRGIFQMVLDLGPEHAGAVVNTWYRSTPSPEARRVVVEDELSWSTYPGWAEPRRTILQLAAQDWDEQIAQKAKRLLAGE